LHWYIIYDFIVNALDPVGPSNYKCSVLGKVLEVQDHVRVAKTVINFTADAKVFFVNLWRVCD